MDDNANLSKTFINNQKKLYSGAFEARKIKGLWVVADGLVYDTFSEAKHTCVCSDILTKIKNNEFIDFFLGLDWGWNHPLSCGLYGITSNNVYYKIDELYGSRIDEEAVIGWILAKQKEYGRYFRFLNADNARPELNHKLRCCLRDMIIYSEKPHLQDSISILRGIINKDRLIINAERCKNTIKEFKSYRYPSIDEKLSSRFEEDTPIKQNDDSMDETRYAVAFYETHFKKHIC